MGMEVAMEVEAREKRYLAQLRYSVELPGAFALAEIKALARLEGLDPSAVVADEDFDEHVPFVRVWLPDDATACRMCERAVLVKAIFDLWGAGENYDALRASLRAYPAERKAPFLAADQNWCLSSETFGLKLSSSQQRMRRERLMTGGDHGLDFKGKVRLEGPGRHLFWILEHVGHNVLLEQMRSEGLASERKSLKQMKRERRKEHREKLREENLSRPRVRLKKAAKAEAAEAALEAAEKVRREGGDEAAQAKAARSARAGFGQKAASERKAKRLEELGLKPGEKAPKEQYDPASTAKIKRHREEQERLRQEVEPKMVYFGREVGRSPKFSQYCLKNRVFLGPTSMDNNMAFVMGNLAQIRPGSLVLDPFVGTGSILVPCTVLGGVCLGGDIDYLTLRGKEGKTAFSCFDQFKLPHPDLLRLDFSPRGRCLREPQGGWLDAIVCDPPYGIRAGARKVGTTKEVKPIPEELRESHIAPTQSYETSDLMVDLVDAAARLLKVGGRLVYLLPVVRTEYTDSVIPKHACLELEANCEQELRPPVSRRLICMRKCAPYDDARAAEYVAESRDALQMPNWDLLNEDGSVASANNDSDAAGAPAPVPAPAARAITGVRSAMLDPAPRAADSNVSES